MVFVPVARTEEIPAGAGRLIERDGTVLAVFNAGGRFYACGAVCPHEDGPLAEGWVEDGAAVCPWHGFDFDLETGRCRVDPALAVAVYPARVRDGLIEVDLP